MNILLAMYGAVSQGVLWGIMCLGLYITYKVLDFADLTVDGSFALGGAVNAALIVLDCNPLVALFISFIAGGISGIVTGLLNTKLKIPGILAGILTMIALYSINIRIMGRANISLLGETTLMTQISSLINTTTTTTSFIIGTIFSVIIIFAMYWFFGTEIGSAIRATGNNEKMVRAQGVNTDNMKILGLMLGNALVALSGGLVAQSQGYGDVQMGTGTIVIGLASIIIGEVIFGKRFSFWYILMSVVMGSIIYRVIIAIVLQLGLTSSDLKLFTAVTVALALSIPVMKSKFANKKKN
ncbi:MAG: ABC transporter permease [Spirochaetaceae bacterium]|nr:ABC transporter permease [Spirochaetaceae bacterium]